MKYEELLKIAPDLDKYVDKVPAEIDGHFVLKKYGPHELINQKGTSNVRIGILLSGAFRVINELENGNIFMIEMNEAISYVGEVALLAGEKTTSVTIETVTDCVIAYLPVADFDLWLHKDIKLMRAVSSNVAKKLYCSSYNRGERLFYSSAYILLKHIVSAVEDRGLKASDIFTLKKTRALLCEEVGMTLKTMNRTIKVLSDDGLISISHGKITLSAEQYEMSKRKLAYYKSQSKNGNAGK